MSIETIQLPFRQIAGTYHSLPSFESDSGIQPPSRVDVYVYGPNSGGSCCNSTPPLVAIWTTASTTEHFSAADRPFVKVDTLVLLEQGFDFAPWVMTLVPGAYRASARFHFWVGDSPTIMPLLEIVINIATT